MKWLEYQQIRKTLECLVLFYDDFCTYTKLEATLFKDLFFSIKQYYCQILRIMSSDKFSAPLKPCQINQLARAMLMS